MKNFLKQNKGVAGTDTIIAILIITLFAGLIATISYNIYISNTSLKKMTNANNYVIDILEYTDKLFYDELTTTAKLKEKYTYLQDAQSIGQSANIDCQRMWKLEGQITKEYKAIITLDKYKPDQNSLDLVRKITVTVKYNIGKKDQDISISVIKSRENLDYPNKPDLSILNVSQNEIIYKVKTDGQNYVICDANDEEWYKYDIDDPSESITAKVIITTDELEVGDIISDEDYDILEWTPRYVEDLELNKIFLYSNTNSYIEVNENGFKTLVDSNLDASQNFGRNTGIWEEL